MKTLSTKRALFASVLSLLLCVTMLVGSTFAWFTDTATASVNTIQAGTLDVALEMKDNDGNWVTAEGKTLQFLVDGRIPAEGTKILWEPGCTYSLPALRIVNGGNLALKYKVVITGIDGDAKLLDVISFTYRTADGTDFPISEEGHLGAGESTAAITITGKMAETASNDYQGLAVEGIGITVVATQDTAESDSSDNTYDTAATYLNTDKDGNVLISNADELVYFSKTIRSDARTYAGKTVLLTEDIDLAGRKWFPIQTGAAANAFVFDGQGHIISNLRVSGEKNVGLFGTATGMTIRNLTVDGATVDGINHVAVIAGDALCTTIENCHVRNAVVTTSVKNNDDGDKAGAIAGYLSAEPNASVRNCSAENCTIQGYRDIGGIVGYANSAAIIIENSVKDSTIVNDRTINYKHYTTDAEFDANAVVGEYNHATLDESNTVTNVSIDSIVPMTITGNADASAAGSGDSSIKNAFEEAVTTDAAHLVIDLTSDVVYDLNGYTLPMGGESTKTITINGNGHTITFNKLNSDANSVMFGNHMEKFIINNAVLTGAGTYDNTGVWNRRDIVFTTNVELNNVTSLRGIALASGKKSILKNVIINDTDAPADVYALWIQAGADVEIDGLVIHAKSAVGKNNRAIAIKDQYITNPALTKLSVKNAVIESDKKAAILVTSKGGAEITLENINIDDVVADTVHPVWVDNGSEYSNLADVTVIGGTAIVEP